MQVRLLPGAPINGPVAQLDRAPAYEAGQIGGSNPLRPAIFYKYVEKLYRRNGK